MASRKLEPRQERFCQEYIKDLNATQAAIRAGYSEKSAHVNGPRLLSNARVKQKVAELQEKRAGELDISAEKVLKELAKMAFANIGNIYDDQGKLMPVHEMPEDVSACLQEVTEDIAPEGQVRRKYKMADKKATLELLGRHLGMWVDRKEVSQRISIDADFGLDEDE